MRRWRRVTGGGEGAPASCGLGWGRGRTRVVGCSVCADACSRGCAEGARILRAWGGVGLTRVWAVVVRALMPFADCARHAASCGSTPVCLTPAHSCARILRAVFLTRPYAESACS